MTEPMTPERLEEIRRVCGVLPYAEDLLSHIERQAQEIAALREALGWCADDLEAEIKARSTPVASMRPDERRRFERDMEPVDKARRLLAAPEGAEEG